MKILVLGETCTDVYRFGRCERLSAEAPVPILLQTDVKTRPGMAANVALNITSLGHSAVHITNRSKIIKERFICSTVAGVNQQVLRVDSNDSCDELVLDDLYAILQQHEFDATVISDYNKGFLTQNILIQVLDRCPGPVFVDSKKQDLTVYDECWIKINKHEHNTAKSIPKNCEIITTLGENGAEYNGKIYPAHDVHDVFDVCGAGDSFLAALAVKYVETNDIEPAIEFANLCAGISVSHLGVYNVTLDDIRNEK